jgi:hypothetical protein
VQGWPQLADGADGTARLLVLPANLLGRLPEAAPVGKGRLRGGQPGHAEGATGHGRGTAGARRGRHRGTAGGARQGHGRGTAEARQRHGRGTAEAKKAILCGIFHLPLGSVRQQRPRRRAYGPPVASSARTTISQPVDRWMESGNDCCASVRTRRSTTWPFQPWHTKVSGTRPGQVIRRQALRDPQVRWRR